MLIVKLTLIIIFSNFFLYNLGFVFSRKEKEDQYSNIFLGFSLLIIILSLLYFFFDLQLIYIKIFLLLIFIICLFNNLRFKNFLKDYLEILFLILIPILLHSVIIKFYGEQFFIFRGNYYDNLNYTSLAVMMSKFSNSEILSFINEPIKNHENLKIFFYLNNAIIYFDARPMVSLINALFYDPNYIKLYEANFIFKIFLLVLVPIGMKKFLDCFSDFKKNNNNYIYSQVFTLSFWVIYVLEIDANSQMAVFGLSIFYLNYIQQINHFFQTFKVRDLILLSVFASTFFILYAEQAVIYFFITFLFLITKNLDKFKTYKFYLSCFLFFILFIIILYPHSYLYKFIVQQIVHGTTSINHWWGYFGSFILGAKNIVTNEDHIQQLKNILGNKNYFSALYYIHENNSLYYGNLYWLNIFPSLFGLYFLNGVFNQFFLLNSLINLLITLFLIYLLQFNLKKIFKLKDNLHHLIKVIIIFATLFCIFLFMKLSFWSIIKFYFYLSSIIFLVIIYSLVTLKKKLFFTTNFFLLLICLMPIYKFSQFNYGIGRSDSFPSNIKKILKTDLNWSFDIDRFKSCNKVYVKSFDRYIDTILSYKLSYYNINNVEFSDKFSLKDTQCNLNISKNLK